LIDSSNIAFAGRECGMQFLYFISFKFCDFRIVFAPSLLAVDVLIFPNSGWSMNLCITKNVNLFLDKTFPIKIMNFEIAKIKMAKWLDEYLGRWLIRAVHFLQLGKRRKPCQQPEVRKILFIKFWGIGSIILAEPALAEIRKAHPNAQLHFLTLAQNRELFALLPHVDRAITIGFSQPLFFLFSALKAIRLLRKMRYDVIFDAEFFSNVSVLFGRLAAPKKLTGFSRQLAVRKVLLDQPVRFRQDRHASENFFALVLAGIGEKEDDDRKPRQPVIEIDTRYTPLYPPSRGEFCLENSRSNGLRRNAVFDAPRRVVAQISSIIKRKVSVWWTQERPGLHSHAERGNEVFQNPPLRGAKGGVKRMRDLQNTVVINPNASPLALERRWPKEYFVQLGKWLLQHYDANLAFIGSLSERKYTAEIAAAVAQGSGSHQWQQNGRFKIISLAGRLSLHETAILMQHARLVISNDSGPLHLAAALQTPVAGIFGPETPVRFGPLCEKKLILYLGLPCSPCMSVENAKTVNCTNQLRCTRDMTPEFVLPKIARFIQQHALLEKSRQISLLKIPA
jgi:ADP-heptose:LPS heptosyltransferase